LRSIEHLTSGIIANKLHSNKTLLLISHVVWNTLVGIDVHPWTKVFPLCVFILSYFAWNLLPSKDITWEFYYSVICTPYCNKTLMLYLGNKFYAKYDSIKTQRGKDFCPEVYHMSIRGLMISITLDRSKRSFQNNLYHPILRAEHESEVSFHDF